MAERFRPRTGDMVYQDGMDPEWFRESGYQAGDNPNGEVIEVTWKGAYVEFFRGAEQKFFEKEFFEYKEYPPDQGGYGFWKLGD